MMSQGPKSVLVCGLPGSGKTTYLAALWHLLQSNEVETELALQSLAFGEYEYVNEIRRRWLRGRKQIRTVGTAREIGLDLESRDGRAGRLVFLDHSGETFDQLWELRSCSQAVAEQIRNRSGIALFIRSEGIKAPVALSDMLQIEREMRDAMLEHGEGQAAEVQPERNWSASDSPDQVKVVDMLQVLAQELQGAPHERMAIIVSAWDRVGEHSSAEDFITHQLPLLSQYLRAGNHPFEYRFYGVSAQGCEYVEEDYGEELPEALTALLAMDEASKRIQLVDGPGERCDLTLPVGWLIGRGLRA